MPSSGSGHVMGDLESASRRLFTDIARTGWPRARQASGGSRLYASSTAPPRRWHAIHEITTTIAASASSGRSAWSAVQEFLRLVDPRRDAEGHDPRVGGHTNSRQPRETRRVASEASWRRDGQSCRIELDATQGSTICPKKKAKVSKPQLELPPPVYADRLEPLAS